MKKFVFFLLLFAIATTAIAQKKMVKIEMPVAIAQETDDRVVNIETTVNVRFTTETFAVLITKNNVTTYQVNHNGELVDGEQYVVFLQVEKDDQRDVKPAVLLGYSKSVHQIYSDIGSMRKTFIKTEK